jgi:ABC-type multidrug transport system fused ATPase/permease subunit
MVFRSRVRDSYTTIRIKVAAMNAFLQENLTGISLVHLFRQEDASLKRFDRLNAEHRDAFLRSVRAYAVYFPTVELLETLAVALILGFGGAQVLGGALTFGVLFAFLQYSERFFRPIRDLSERYNILQGAMASSERIFELLDTEPEVKTPAQPRRPARIDGEVRFDAVGFGYKAGEPVLHDLTFRIAPGEAVALVGHTGAGKTTIASLLVRTYDVWSGAIRIDGVDVREWEIARLRRQIAVVPQDVFLFSGSASRNIGLRDPSVTEEQIRAAADAVAARPFLERLPQGMETELRERGSLLSVGQRQLLSFARALARDPRILASWRRDPTMPSSRAAGSTRSSTSSNSRSRKTRSGRSRRAARPWIPGRAEARYSRGPSPTLERKHPAGHPRLRFRLVKALRRTASRAGTPPASPVSPSARRTASCASTAE